MTSTGTALPEWPVFTLDSRMTVAAYDCDVIAYWESRCRLAVEALDEIARECIEETDADIAQTALHCIGPLPEKQP